MNKITRIAILAIIIIATVAVLAFYGLKPKTSVAPVVSEPVKVTAPRPAPQATQTPVEQMAALPADNKQAIDSELQGIDQALQSTEAALSSDVADGELGL